MINTEAPAPTTTHRARAREWDSIAQMWLKKAEGYMLAGWRDSAAACYRDAANALMRAKENADLAGDPQI